MLSYTKGPVSQHLSLNQGRIYVADVILFVYSTTDFSQPEFDKHGGPVSMLEMYFVCKICPICIPVHTKVCIFFIRAF